MVNKPDNNIARRKAAGTIKPIGDNRYGLRAEYDPQAKAEMLKKFKRGDTLEVKMK